MNIEIANRLVQLRKANNLSQEALAEKLGLSRQAVSKWERAESSPDTDNLILLAKIYRVSLDELLKTEEDIIPIITEDKIENEDDNNSYSDFPVALVITIVYILLGTFWGVWHPGWVIYLTIPFYYYLVASIKNKRQQNSL